MIDRELEARIRRLFFAEHWKVGTIVSELSVHRDAVLRSIGAENFMRGLKVERSPLLDPFSGFIKLTLEQHPRLRATRLFEMLKARGFAGGVHAVRRYLRRVRPKPKHEVFFRLETLPGEQGQVDWAHFGKVTVGNTQRTLSCFVMVLSHSRAMYARFFLDQTTENFLRGHVEAFTAFSGCPRKVLYDNLKSVVIDRVGDHVRFNPRLLELANYYHFEPRPCAPYRGNEKGKVERQIHYLRYSFFEGRIFRSLDLLNQELWAWIDSVAHARTIQGQGQPVSERLLGERERLLPLPENPFVPDSVHSVLAKKTPYIRFDQNDYSIPHTHVGLPLTLIASETTVRILDGLFELARHKRSYERHRRFELEQHLAALQAEKRRARELRGRHRLFDACPSAGPFLTETVARGESPSHTTLALLRLVDAYDPKAVDDAIKTAALRGAFGVGSVEHIIEQDRRKRRLQPPIGELALHDERARSLRTKPHALAGYDALSKPTTGAMPPKAGGDGKVQS
jgi:transposase